MTYKHPHRTMRKIATFAFGALMMASCSKSYIQIVEVTSEVPVLSNNYVDSDGSCRVTYNLWSQGGDPGFVVENLTDKVLYIDLSNTFLIKNGAAYDYFRNRTYGNSSSSTITKGVSATASAYGVWAVTRLAGSKSASSSSASSITSTSAVTVNEKSLVAIPPHAHKTFSEYSISDIVIQDCSVRMFPQRNRPEGRSFSKQESPITFTNYITYHVGEEGTPQIITQEFYVSAYKNYCTKDVVEKEKVGCKKQKFVQYNKYGTPAKYYIMYNANQNNNYSADAVDTASFY